jgi:hypothetical protein
MPFTNNARFQPRNVLRRPKAAVNAAQARRLAPGDKRSEIAERLDCDGFSTAFGRRTKVRFVNGGA